MNIAATPRAAGFPESVPARRSTAVRLGEQGIHFAAQAVMSGSMTRPSARALMISRVPIGPLNRTRAGGG